MMSSMHPADRALKLIEMHGARLANKKAWGELKKALEDFRRRGMYEEAAALQEGARAEASFQRERERDPRRKRKAKRVPKRQTKRRSRRPSEPKLKPGQVLWLVVKYSKASSHPKHSMLVARTAKEAKVIAGRKFGYRGTLVYRVKTYKQQQSGEKTRRWW